MGLPIPKKGDSSLSLMTFFISSSLIFRVFAILGTCKNAESAYIYPSKPLADVSTRSAGMGVFISKLFYIRRVLMF